MVAVGGGVGSEVSSKLVEGGELYVAVHGSPVEGEEGELPVRYVYGGWYGVAVLGVPPIELFLDETGAPPVLFHGY